MMKYKYFAPIEIDFKTLEPDTPLIHSCFVDVISYIENMNYEEAESLLKIAAPDSKYFIDKYKYGFHDDEIEVIIKDLYDAELEGTLPNTKVRDIMDDGLFIIACSNGDDSHITIVDHGVLHDHSNRYLDWSVDYIAEVVL